MACAGVSRQARHASQGFGRDRKTWLERYGADNWSSRLGFSYCEPTFWLSFVIECSTLNAVLGFLLPLTLWSWEVCSNIILGY